MGFRTGRSGAEQSKALDAASRMELGFPPKLSAKKRYAGADLAYAHFD